MKSRKEVPTGALNVNQLRRLLANKDPEIARQVKALWGTVREGRNPGREQVINTMRDLLGYARRNYLVGDPLIVDVLRGGKRVGVRLVLK